MHIFIFANMSFLSYTCKYICKKCIHLHLNAHTRAHLKQNKIYTNIYIYANVYVCAHMYIYIHIYIYMYTFAFLHVYIKKRMSTCAHCFWGEPRSALSAVGRSRIRVGMQQGLETMASPSFQAAGSNARSAWAAESPGLSQSLAQARKLANNGWTARGNHNRTLKVEWIQWICLHIHTFIYTRKHIYIYMCVHIYMYILSNKYFLNI